MEPLEANGTREADHPDNEEIEMPVFEDENQLEKSPAENQAEISLEYDEEQGMDDLPTDDAAEPLPGEPDIPREDDLDAIAGGGKDKVSLSENSAAAGGKDDAGDGADETLDGQAPQGGQDAALSNQLHDAAPHEENDTNIFEGLYDDKTGDRAPQPQGKSKDAIPDEMQIEDKAEKAAAEPEDRGAAAEHRSLNEVAETDAGTPELPQPAAAFSLVNKIISGALIALIVAGLVLYYNPSLIGLTRTPEPTAALPAPAVEAVAPAAPAVQPVTTPPRPGKQDQCLAKIEEAVRLRNLLLEKNEEIYELDLHYRTGIAELMAETNQLIEQTNTTTYEAALKNKPIELNMLTIQRRQAYIKGLTKPAFWLNNGSEELLYLVRKARLDMQLLDIAGGIDLKKHMRHIDAAIQRYRPGTEKIVLDPQQTKMPPLELIWDQVNKKQPAGGNREIKYQSALNPKDKRIINEICSGNFERIAELTHISTRAAGCLARMNGSDLFLNSLTTVSPDAAEQLFQWQGNWICLNGVTQLSPSAAAYLFRWKGNWISLNSLSEFPPELAEQLLQWEGHQLELMGLKYKEDDATQKTLKYLALWETAGGKLFVSDLIRQKIKRLM